jgi:hypothetical protein
LVFSEIVGQDYMGDWWRMFEVLDSDFADMLDVGLAAEADASLFATFNQVVAKFVDVPDVAVETLTSS